MGLSGFIKTALCFIIGVSMAAMRRRNPPKTDAIVHAAKGLDKTAGLEVKYIDSFKGMVCVFIILWFWYFLVLTELTSIQGFSQGRKNSLGLVLLW